MTNKELNELIKNNFLNAGWNISVPFLDGTFTNILKELREIRSNNYRFYPRISQCLEPFYRYHIDDLKVVVFRHENSARIYRYNPPKDIVVVHYPFTVPYNLDLQPQIKKIWYPLLEYILEELLNNNVTIIEDGGDELVCEKILTTNFPNNKEIIVCNGIERKTYKRDGKIWLTIIDDLKMLKKR